MSQSTIKMRFDVLVSELAAQTGVAENDVRTILEKLGLQSALENRVNQEKFVKNHKLKPYVKLLSLANVRAENLRVAAGEMHI